MKAKHLSEEILEHLLNSDFANGEPVREIDLAKKFNVSPTPIREALNNLEARGFLQRRKRKGTFLNPFSFDELNEIYNIRSVLEGLAARMLTERATPAVIENLKEINARFKKTTKDRMRSTLSAIDIEFHSAIVESCGSDRLATLIRDFHIISKTFGTLSSMKYYPKDAIKNPYAHGKLIKSIEDKEPAKAERIARKHVEWVKNYWLKYMGMQK